jgi:hypothetical protein
MRKTYRSILTVVGLIVSAAGCSAGGESASSARTPADLGPVKSPEAKSFLTTLSLPLDAYRQTAKERALLQRAVDLEVNVCLRGFGFAGLPILNQEEGLAQEEDEEARSRFYGVTDLAAAREWGYSKKNFDRPPPDINMPDMTGNLAVVYFGKSDPTNPEDAPPPTQKISGKSIPQGGCLGAAGLKVLGSSSLATQFTKADEIAINAAAQTNADARVLGYWKEWSSCMKSRGYVVSSPFKAIEELKIDMRVKATAKVIQIAVTDVECKQKTDLVEKWHKVQVEYDNKAIEKNQLLLTEERSRLNKALAIAAQVVAEK